MSAGQLPPPDKWPNAQHCYTAEQMREYGQASRKQALEEAAKIIAKVGFARVDGSTKYYFSCSDIIKGLMK